MSNPKIGLVAFGEVGTGKSTLCNTLIGSNGTAFTESERTEAQTFETIGKEGKFGNQETLYGAITRPGGYIQLMQNQTIPTEVKKMQNMKINKYSGVLKSDYMETVKE